MGGTATVNQQAATATQSTLLVCVVSTRFVNALTNNLAIPWLSCQLHSLIEMQIADEFPSRT